MTLMKQGLMMSGRPMKYHIKKCFKCEVSKRLSEFYTHRGMADKHLGKCKDCTKKDSAKRYWNEREKIIIYEKKRFKDPRRKRKKLEYQRIRRRRFPEKDKARRMVQIHLKSGKITKSPCRDCGSLMVQAHHTDYSKGLDVIWLCRQHHVIEHGKIPF